MNPDAAETVAAVLPPDAPPFAFAFSGGGDSLALLGILKAHSGLRAVLHVDHGLRDTSQAEAAQAADLAAGHGHDLVILRWSADGPTSGLQEKARRARYGLMGDYCRLHRIPALVTAHHADDQAETVLMRVKRASGWRGAAGMRTQRYGPVWPELAGVTLVRPALCLRRAALRSGLEAGRAIEDPSNGDLSFERVRTRRELQAHPELISDMLALAADMADGLSADMARIRAALNGYHLTHEGQFSVPRLIGEPALSLVAPIVGGQGGPADRARIAARLPDLASGDPVAIGEGCMGRWDGEILTLSRDPVAMTGRKDRRLAPTAVPIAVTPEPAVWDGRFLVSGEGGQLHPERRGLHVGYRVHYGRTVKVRNLVEERLSAALTLS
ncbi:tRNA lysidine(34) synthetase TilS [uncultured Algimonas sp.]|uniref:tRNA lysidine(34) synthetase TilS n=1 Tax=uncultured Algimonas sp. TaxID=1547920 RepID=UPI0026268D33|nr:tRNA lysidine(34) synthetase TilS [uncultured Algimonas sp.]